MRSSFSAVGIASAMILLLAGATGAAEPLTFTVKLDAVLEHDDGKFLWFLPRMAAIPSARPGGKPSAWMTLQKHLSASDHYSGLYVMRSDDLGATWTKPALPPELDWRKEPNAVNAAIMDVTPGWHAPTNKLIVIGAETRYNQQGQPVSSEQAAYAVLDPRTGQWTGWKRLALPPGGKFDFSYCCGQWLTREDGQILVPLYFGSRPWKAAVALCTFDGTDLKYVRHGTELTLSVDRGLVEPSLALFKGKYYLTLRNDQKGYVTVSEDGLTFKPIKAWTFDDGKDLGSYNTQQRWLTHSDGLFLAYTRRGANNDHILRHRAPLFLSEVDPEKLHVLRATEKVLIPERGATLGNLGAAAITPEESWVTDAEGIWDGAARKRGAKGATFLARVRWSRPNRLVPNSSKPE